MSEKRTIFQISQKACLFNCSFLNISNFYTHDISELASSRDPFYFMVCAETCQNKWSKLILY